MKMNIVLRYCGNKTEAETLHEAFGPWFFWGSTNEILREEWDGTKEDETPVWHRKLGSNRGQRVFYNNKWIEKVEDWHGICITSIVKLFIVSFAQILYQQYQISASDCRHSQPYKKCTAPCRTLKPQRTLTWPNFICYLTFYVSVIVFGPGKSAASAGELKTLWYLGMPLGPRQWRYQLQETRIQDPAMKRMETIANLLSSRLHCSLKSTR